VRLQELHADMDRAVLDCYGWGDIDPGHGFHQNERGQTRYTIAADVRQEVLRCLVDLSLRLAEEAKGGGARAPPRAGSRNG
jgi:hypothetical protein